MEECGKLVTKREEKENAANQGLGLDFPEKPEMFMGREWRWMRLLLLVKNAASV